MSRVNDGSCQSSSWQRDWQQQMFGPQQSKNPASETSTDEGKQHSKQRDPSDSKRSPSAAARHLQALGGAVAFRDLAKALRQFNSQGLGRCRPEVREVRPGVMASFGCFRDPGAQDSDRPDASMAQIAERVARMLAEQTPNVDR